MLDSWSLRVLVEVARRGSFSAAAEALTLTQPAVSRQIAALERRLDARLFDRLPRGVRLTPAGRAAVEQGEAVLAGLAALETRVRAHANLAAGTLQVMAFPSACTALVPQAFHHFAGRYPGVELSLLAADPHHPARAVTEGRADIALLTCWDLDGETSGIQPVPLLADELLVALPAGHRLATAGRVAIADLAGEAWIEGAHPDCLGPIPELAAALGGPPRVTGLCDDWNGKQGLVAAGTGIMLFPSLALPARRAGITVLPTMPRLPPRQVYAAALPEPERAPAVREMLTILRRTAAEIAKAH